MIFDEGKFGESWRFNSLDCALTDEEKSSIVFLTDVQADIYWRNLISEEFDHLMKIPKGVFTVEKKVELDFEDLRTGESFFSENLRDLDILFFFWGPRNGCVVTARILVKAWSDFFYPSDENSILYVAGRRRLIFSHEDRFFVAKASSAR